MSWKFAKGGFITTASKRTHSGMVGAEARKSASMIEARKSASIIPSQLSCWPGARIVAISGGGRLANTEYLNMARKLGANDVLTKPFEPEELIEVVARCLPGRSAAVARIDREPAAPATAEGPLQLAFPLSAWASDHSNTAQSPSRTARRSRPDRPASSYFAMK
jgi:DNA-binding NarL/FixJ family response regulator